MELPNLVLESGKLIKPKSEYIDISERTCINVLYYYISLTKTKEQIYFEVAASGTSFSSVIYVRNNGQVEDLQGMTFFH